MPTEKPDKYGDSNPVPNVNRVFLSSLCVISHGTIRPYGMPANSIVTKRRDAAEDRSQYGLQQNGIATVRRLTSGRITSSLTFGKPGGRLP